MATLRKVTSAVGVIVLATASGSACAVTQSGSRPDRCQVIGAEKLPVETGGAIRVCSAIEAAAKARAPGSAYSVEVRVVSDSMLAAQVRMANGLSLPEQKMAVSDRKLNRSSIDRFAVAIGEAIGRASGG